MHVLEALLRLRQAACHPGLVDPRRADEPSAKFDALIPQLAEVIDERHKCLVFSQFTSLLALLRARLDADGIRYEYLDGRTRDREEPVRALPGGSGHAPVPHQPQGRRPRTESHRRGVRVPARPVVEPGGGSAGDRSRASHRADAARVRVSTDRAPDTVEEKIVELQATKRDLADAIVRADEGLLRSLSREDLEILLE